MTKLTLNKFTEQEARELENIQECCALYKFRGEYPNSTDRCKWIIATDIAEETLVADYPAAMKRLSPYIIVAKEFVSVRRESHANDEKFKYRDINMNTPFEYSDEITGNSFCGVCIPSFEDDLVNDKESVERLEQQRRNERRLLVRKLLSEMSEKQRTRLIENTVLGMSCREIASKENNNSHNGIAKSIQTARKRFEDKAEILIGRNYTPICPLFDEEGDTFIGESEMLLKNF